jgi:hypothetical protein
MEFGFNEHFCSNVECDLKVADKQGAFSPAAKRPLISSGSPMPMVVRHVPPPHWSAAPTKITAERTARLESRKLNPTAPKAYFFRKVIKKPKPTKICEECTETTG